MDKLTKQVKENILTYPYLFPSRIHVLIHMFLVPGNGFQWKNGVLVDEEEKMSSEKQALANLRENHYKRKAKSYETVDRLRNQDGVGHESFETSLRESLSEELRTQRKSVMNADKFANGDTPEDIRFCDRVTTDNNKIIWPGLHEDNLGYNIPTKSNSVYVAGVIEVLQTKFDHPEWFEQYNEEFIDVSEYIKELVLYYPDTYHMVKRY